MVADPELKTTPTGVNVCSFRIAVGRKFVKAGEQPQTDFIDIVAWRTQAEFVAKYFVKGKPILVCGAIQSRNWQDKDGNKRYTVEVIADEITFVGPKTPSEGGGSFAGDPGPTAPSYSTSYESSPKFEEISADDDLPF